MICDLRGPSGQAKPKPSTCGIRTHFLVLWNFCWYASHSSSVMYTLFMPPRELPGTVPCAWSMFLRARTPRVIELRRRRSAGRSGQFPKRIFGDDEPVRRGSAEVVNALLALDSVSNSELPSYCPAWSVLMTVGAETAE